MTKPNNSIRGWIALAAICLGGSTGGTYLRPPAPHNPAITTAAWVQMTRDVADLRSDMADVIEIIRRLPQQPPQQQP